MARVKGSKNKISKTNKTNKKAIKEAKEEIKEEVKEALENVIAEPSLAYEQKE